MKLIMAVSADGYVARSDHDDMRWLGADDKALFRVLTSVGGECFVGARSYALMPQHLVGRTVRPLSRGSGGTPLEHLRYEAFSGSWLLGGQEVALKALGITVVDSHISWVHPATYVPLIQEVHLCRSARHAFPDDRRFFDRITPLMMAHGMTPAITTRFGDATHELWRLEAPLPVMDDHHG
jgi:dihydrofolate reductase